MGIKWESDEKCLMNSDDQILWKTYFSRWQHKSLPVVLYYTKIILLKPGSMAQCIKCLTNDLEICGETCLPNIFY